jgi:hypothetical protein
LAFWGIGLWGIDLVPKKRIKTLKLQKTGKTQKVATFAKKMRQKCKKP